MKFLIPNHFKINNFLALLVLIALFSSINNFYAQNRIFQLYIENPNTGPISKVSVDLTPGRCYEGTMPNTYIKGGTRQLLGDVARVQGHGCDGENGYFTLRFFQDYKEFSNVYFGFSNSGGLWIVGQDGHYGTLHPKEGNSYTYTTHKWPKPSRVEGYWKLICRGSCDQIVKEGFRLYSGRETNYSQVINAVSFALSAGTDALVNTRFGYEKALIDTYTRIVSGTQTNESTKRNVVSPEQMKAIGTHTMWQWVANIGYDRASYTIATSITTCTSGYQPNYGPLDPETVGRCSGGTSNSTSNGHTVLTPGQVLKPGEKLVSTNGIYYLEMQKDGNLCLKKTASDVFIWCMTTDPNKLTKGTVCAMQEDGNLNVSPKEKWVWSAFHKPSQLTRGSYLKLTNEGEIKIIAPNGTVKWQNR